MAKENRETHGGGSWSPGRTRALMVLVVCIQIGLGLVRDPGEVFVVVSGHAP